MGFTLVVGRNNCKLDNAYSNGSGKSAIFNGLCFALTGETTQGISTGIENIFTNPDDCWVKLKFKVDSDEFEVQRIKTPKQNLKIFINGEDKSGKGIRESSQLLAEYIPDLTPELLSSIIILGQGMPHRFTNNKPSHRKELLESLTKSDFMIQSIKDSLESRQTDLRLLLREKEDSLIANNSQLTVYNNQLDKFNQELEEYNTLLNNSDIDTEISNVKGILSSIDSELETHNTNLKEYSKLLTDNMLARTTLISERDEEINSDTKDFDLSINDKTNRQYEINAELRTLNKEIKKLEAITDICPTCGQKIPDIKKPSTKEQHKEVDKLTKEYNKISEEIQKLNSDKSKIIDELKNKYNKKLDELDNSNKTIKNEIEVKQKTVNDLTVNKNKLTEKLYKMLNLKENYTKLQSDIDNTTNQINELNTLIQNINLEISNTNSHLDIVQQMITLAKREFRGILLSNVINFIDKKVKSYSKEVFGTDKLAFTLNDNYIDITYCDKLYENLSGGEKQKIDIIIQLALRDILSKQLNIHSNLLVLDEIYDNADAISCQKITNLISTLTDIDSIFIISHHVQDLGLTYDNQLLVEKNSEGISSITFS